jgi:hypothetical protein
MERNSGGAAVGAGYCSAGPRRCQIRPYPRRQPGHLHAPLSGRSRAPPEDEGRRRGVRGRRGLPHDALLLDSVEASGVTRVLEVGNMERDAGHERCGRRGAGAHPHEAHTGGAAGVMAVVDGEEVAVRVPRDLAQRVLV